MTDNPQAPPKRRWLMPLFLVSMALNLLIVGIAAGWMFSAKGPSKGERISGPSRSLIGEPFVRALSKEDRESLIKSIRSNQDRLRENRKALKTRFESFLIAVTADPFDADAVRELLGAQRSVAVNRQEIGETLLIERLSSMNLEQRQEYAARLSRSLRHLRRD